MRAVGPVSLVLTVLLLWALPLYAGLVLGVLMAANLMQSQATNVSPRVSVAVGSALLAALGLPTTYREDAFPALLESMRMDKKARGSRIRMVVLDGLARPGTVDNPDPAVLAAAYSEVTR